VVCLIYIQNEEITGADNARQDGCLFVDEHRVELLIAAVVPTHKALGDPQIPRMSQQPMI
jgi:hypothetical protein